MLVETAALIIALTLPLQQVDVQIGPYAGELPRQLGVEAMVVFPFDENVGIVAGIDWTPGFNGSIGRWRYPVRAQDEIRAKVGFIYTW